MPVFCLNPLQHYRSATILITNYILITIWNFSKPYLKIKYPSSALCAARFM